MERYLNSFNPLINDKTHAIDEDIFKFTDDLSDPLTPDQLFIVMNNHIRTTDDYYFLLTDQLDDVFGLKFTKVDMFEKFIEQVGIVLNQDKAKAQFYFVPIIMCGGRNDNELLFYGIYICADENKAKEFADKVAEAIGEFLKEENLKGTTTITD